MKVYYWNIVEQIPYFQSRKAWGVFYLLPRTSVKTYWYGGKSPKQNLEELGSKNKKFESWNEIQFNLFYK